MAGLSRITVADLPPRYQAQVAKKLQQVQQKKEAKYHNEKTEVNGIRFDSRKEAERYQALMDYQAEGYIKDLRLQEDITLQEAYTKPDGTRVRAIRYRADFTYRTIWAKAHENRYVWGSMAIDVNYWDGLGRDTKVIEDAKGVRTDVYKMKKKMAANLGIEIREV